MDAVEQAVYRMEDSGLFNAGLGACLTAEGTAELEAGICRGSDRATGSVLRVTQDPHPIQIARFILERTDLVSMHGDRALELMGPRGPGARKHIVTGAKLAQWRELLSKAAAPGSHFGKFHPHSLQTLLKSRAYREVRKIGTVGAVALDRSGELAAANSTGGFWLKLPGRIGDSPVYGAGYYASPRGAAASTGVGEHMVRTHFCRAIVEGMDPTTTPQRAVRSAFEELEGLLGGDNAGVVAVDRQARVGAWHNTAGMGHAYLTSRMTRPVVRASAPSTHA